ncbi:DUF2197 domain-containing protein [Fredinandcohnia sp. FSL W7-1320]|uniref:DUF2197 domain-containing protein n=1 Tax=Fredinandcohnia sp. FSL W7-1320 TaxID=2954540 RepID=UPI0030FDC3B2
MFFYEVLCTSCRKVFRVYKGSLHFKLIKKNKTKYFCCEDCSHKIRMDAIKNFFRYLN